jgi:hypothetical protein
MMFNINRTLDPYSTTSRSRGRCIFESPHALPITNLHCKKATVQVVSAEGRGGNRQNQAAQDAVMSAVGAIGRADRHVDVSGQYHARHGGRQSSLRQGRHRPHLDALCHHGRERAGRFQHDQTAQWNLHSVLSNDDGCVRPTVSAGADTADCTARQVASQLHTNVNKTDYDFLYGRKLP